MTIKEGLQCKGKVWIAGASRNDLPSFLKENGYLNGAEIGVYKGYYSKQLAEVGLNLLSIDPWVVYRGAGPNRQKQERQDYLYARAKKYLAPYPNCKIIRKPSIEAAKDIPKKSLDFVYIDGDHEFGPVAMDLAIWIQKVRQGGIIAGHDYFSTVGNRGLRGVHYAVDAFCENSDINDVYILGHPDDEKKDESLSFVIFKHW
jgi:hypothetical protein